MKIIFVSYNFDIFSNPTLVLVFNNLLAEGFSVKLVAPPQRIQNKGLQNRISLFSIPPFFFRIREKFSLIKQYTYTITKLIGFGNRAIVGIDPMGFVTAARLNRFLKTKLGYFSFEMLFEEETVKFLERTGDPKFYRVHKLEKLYFNKIDFFLIQDLSRYNSICTENNFKPDKTFFIPVAYSINVTGRRKIDLRQKFNIPSEKKIIVFSGSIQKWTGVFKLLENFDAWWDNRFWLLLHSRFPLNNEQPEIKHIHDLVFRGRQVSLHSNPFEEFSDLADFLCGADFGMVSYETSDHPFHGKNLANIGLASGKFSLYMMLGLPVAFNSLATYRVLHENYNFGEPFDDFSQFPEILPRLLENENFKRKECLRLYKEVLCPNSGIKQLLEYLS